VHSDPSPHVHGNGVPACLLHSRSRSRARSHRVSRPPLARQSSLSLCPLPTLSSSPSS
jgi:hypothetical protein